jgi:hypothetical protein
VKPLSSETLKKEGYTDDSAISYLKTVYSESDTVDLSSSSITATSEISLIPQTRSGDDVKYKVEEQNDQGGWSIVGSSDYSASKVLGTRNTLVNSSNASYKIYRITTQYYLYGTTATNGKENHGTFYLKVNFTTGTSSEDSTSQESETKTD